MRPRADRPCRANGPCRPRRRHRPAPALPEARPDSRRGAAACARPGWALADGPPDAWRHRAVAGRLPRHVRFRARVRLSRTLPATMELLRERIPDGHVWWRIADPAWRNPLDPGFARRDGVAGIRPGASLSCTSTRTSRRPARTSALSSRNGHTARKTCATTRAPPWSDACCRADRPCGTPTRATGYMPRACQRPIRFATTVDPCPAKRVRPLGSAHMRRVCGACAPAAPRHVTAKVASWPGFPGLAAASRVKSRRCRSRSGSGAGLPSAGARRATDPCSAHRKRSQ